MHHVLAPMLEAGFESALAHIVDLLMRIHDERPRSAERRDTVDKTLAEAEFVINAFVKKALGKPAKALPVFIGTP